MAKRSDALAVDLKRYISEQGLLPGDRLPQEKQLMETYRAAKSTVREALKSLQAQGLIKIKTGPGGGAVICDASFEKATDLLSSFFYFKNLSIHDIYQLRIVLEPELAASVIGRLKPEDFKRLQSTMCIYDTPPTTPEEEHAQRIAEFDFHEVLVQLCPNPLLSFVCHFLMALLKNLDFCHNIYEHPYPELMETGRHYQMQLLSALKREATDDAKNIMRNHMIRAEALMQAKEATVKRRFFTTHPDAL